MKFSQRRLARPSVGGLLATRQGSLVLALVCAIAAAGVLVFALGRYKSKLNTVPQQATVLVATGEIKQGTTGAEVAAQRLYKAMPVIASQLTPGALSNASSLPDEIVKADILPGQQLTASDFATAVGPSALLTPSQRAISVAIDEAHGDTDALQPGDHVDVYATFGVGSGSGSGSAVTSAMVLLVPDALVIKPASGAVVHAGGRTISGGSLVLAVSSTLAPQVAFASDNGKLFLALRPTNATTTPSTPTTLKSILAAHSGNVVSTIPGGGS